MAAAAAISGRLADVRKFAVSELGPQREALEFVGSKPPVPPAPMRAKPMSGAASAGAGGEGSLLKLTKLEAGIAAPLRLENVDTDCIIPSQFLKTIKRSGLGVSAFFELRYAEDGKTENPDFVLNQEPYRQAQVLITLENFGCGSSREHAPWAIKDFGIRVIIAPSFADIFSNNCFKNGMLPLVLPKEQVEVLMQDAEAKKNISVDLNSQQVIRADGTHFTFEVDSFRKHCLLNGLDDIGLTMQKTDRIEEFEGIRSARYPWLDGPSYKQ